MNPYKQLFEDMNRYAEKRCGILYIFKGINVSHLYTEKQKVNGNFHIVTHREMDDCLDLLYFLHSENANGL